MVQMNASDQAVLKAMPGNAKCADCGMKNPQWASVPFGIVFCLDCSGVHRYVEVFFSQAMIPTVQLAAGGRGKMSHQVGAFPALQYNSLAIS